MEEIESEGKTVAEAVENTLRKSGLRRDQVEVQIINEASSGFMGIGARPARVRVREKRWAADGSPLPSGAPTSATTAPKPPSRAPAPVRQAPRPARVESVVRRPAPKAPRNPERAPEPAAAPSAKPSAPLTEQAAQFCERTVSLLKEMLPLMNLADASVSARWDPEQDRVKADVETKDAERLIGRDGKTLESLQFLVTLILSRRCNMPVAVWVDAQGYWEKKEKELLSQAQAGIETVKSTGRPFRFPPMSAPLRRLVHRNLAGHPDVVTSSEGEGSWRKIVIKPRKG